MSRPPVFNVELLYEAVDRKRRADRLHWSGVARACGMNASTFTRIALDSKPPNVDSLCRLLLWLGNTDLKPYLLASSLNEEQR